jgi:NhaP-type Na+/H+ or K+/H+ antiporter
LTLIKPALENKEMKAHLSRTALIFALISSLLIVPNQAQADATQDFVMSCTYGVLAGTLVGAASLSFTDKPGDKLYRIARGASIGLYAGILLGWYVTSLDDNPQPEEDDEEDYGQFKEPALQVFPLVSDKGIEGGAFKYSLLSF